MAHSDILSQPDRGLGLDRPQTEALLALFSRCDDLREFGREVIQSVVNALMDSQAQEACGAPRGSRSPERVNSRNGYRERSLSTSLGDLELRVPKLREGTYFPEGILERYTRVEASMVALAFMSFPREHWQKIRTNNVQERANREIKRRYRSVQSFPSEASMMRLVCAVLAGEEGRWAAHRVAAPEWAARASAPAPAPEPLEGERLEAVRLAAHEVIREVLDRHGVAE